MAALEFQLKLPDPEEMRPGDPPVEYGMSVIGTSQEQRHTAVLLLRKAADKIEEDTMKKFGTGEIIPEPDDDPTAAPVRTQADRQALAHESAIEAGLADIEAGRVAPLDLSKYEG